MGVGGVGMAGLAVLMKARGHEVSGCDLAASARTKWLEAQGIRVFVGHSPEHLKDVDEVIVTPAVSKGEPEWLALQAANGGTAGIPVRSRGEALAALVNESDGIAVCGSHGKTTTATWIARLLLALGEDVSWCIGGETGSFPVARAAAAGQANKAPLVVEADESDGTLALYRAKTLVVNKCEYDHPDHFRTEADYFACYETARRQAKEVIDSERLEGLEGLEGLGGLEGLEGLAPHNRKNARAAVEVALRRGHSLAAIAAALPPIVAELPDRRFQVVWPVTPQSNGRTDGQPERSNGAPTVVTDYAHHPTEMRCAVEMARRACRGTLRVLFQPHRYSRTKALLKDFPPAFDGADEVVLCPTYAAFEQPVEGGDVADLYRACRDRLRALSAEGAPEVARLFLARSCSEAWEHALNSMSDGDLVLLLGAGDIINLVPQVQKDLGACREPSLRRRTCRKIWIGAGSNTWKSDLDLNVEYVRTAGPANALGSTLGIPWMAGIPGTIGGWVKMNAGAFGHSISEVLAKVKVDGVWLSAADCGFAYRHSDIAGEIQDVILKPVRPAGDAADFLSRRKRFPAGTFGSFFKNPPGDHAGRLLEAVGAKELRVGGAYVWAEHANVIVRGDGATASDVLALARLMRNRVLFRFGIALEAEVCGITF